MARGYDNDRERKAKVSFFGKDLARRSKSCCELCEASGEKLEVFEVPPVPEEPDYDRCIFICSSCKSLLENIDKANENDVRFLNNSIWSEVEMVKAVSVVALRKLESKHPWALDILDTAYIDVDMEEKIDGIDL